MCSRNFFGQKRNSCGKRLKMPHFTSPLRGATGHRNELKGNDANMVAYSMLHVYQLDPSKSGRLEDRVGDTNPKPVVAKPSQQS